MKKKAYSYLLIATSLLAMTGCKKKEAVVVDHPLTAVTVNDLESGRFYVKSGETFYLAPVEDQSFDINDVSKNQIKFSTTRDNETGIEDPNENDRVLAFTNWDNAIPTLYKNDQLVFKSSSGEISGFTWERFKDEGYSIGASGLESNGAGKILCADKSVFYSAGSALHQLSQLEIPDNTDVIIDSMNSTPINSTFLSEAGTINGLTKDAGILANVFIGTNPQQVQMSADTRLFDAFEVYKTANFELSANGYAIVSVPDYLKSGYYLINNVGFFKYIAVDRGNDESSINLETPYYYTDDDGKLLTYYEWADKTGNVSSEMHDNSKKFDESTLSRNPEDYEEQASVIIDNTQESLTATIKYKYKDSNAEDNASRNGIFPHAVLLRPDGKTVLFKENESPNNNEDGYVYLQAESDTAPAGEWYVLYTNFSDIVKNLSVSLTSGNADSYLHNGNDGRITIYYDKSDMPQDITLTWERTDRALTDIKIVAPDHTEYSLEKTPSNVITNEPGKFTIKLPNLVAGEYQFSVKGDHLGRVWVSKKESVTTVQEIIGETEESVPETNEDGTPVETSAEENTESSAAEESNG